MGNKVANGRNLKDKSATDKILKNHHETNTNTLPSSNLHIYL